MTGSANEKRQKKWTLRYPSDDKHADAEVAELARTLGCSSVSAKLLWVRGLKTADEANRFLRLEEENLHDAFLMKDMEKAVARIEKALDNHERITIYGDYDVDGVTSTSLLYLYLKSRGADVFYYIPSRLHEGYGISKSAVDKLAENGTQLMITVDTGITAIEETAYAKEKGIETVVTDHHTCREILPDVCASVNPHRPDDVYPFKNLAGVGVAFKLVSAMELTKARRNGESEIDTIRNLCLEYADLVAVGTIADVMPIVDENRLIVAYGLSRVNKEPRLGLRALADASSGKKGYKKISADFIGFRIAPRMNAAGRMNDATVAVRLLLAEDEDEANAIAEELCLLNAERQKEQARIGESAKSKIAELPTDEAQRVLVLDGEDWHQGIIGIAASEITETYGLPTILVTYDGNPDNDGSSTDVGKGSGRSIKGLNLVDALSACSDLLLRFGGHELAAGLSLRRGDIPEFRRRLNEYAKENLSDDDLCIGIEADCEVEMSDLTEELVSEMNLLEPFGTANPAPVFLMRGAKLTKLSPVGDGKHLRLTVKKGKDFMPAVWFSRKLSDLDFDTSEPVDILFRLTINDYGRTPTLQMQLSDAKATDDESDELKHEKKRYAEINGGGTFSASEDFLPTRESFTAVWRYLKQATLLDSDGFSVRKLLEGVNRRGDEHFGYCKLMFALRIFAELGLCRVTEPIPDRLVLHLCETNGKKDLESSSLLALLRSRVREADL